MVDLSGVPFIDVDGVNALKIAYKRSTFGQVVFLMGDHRPEQFMNSDFFKELESEGKIEFKTEISHLFDNKNSGNLINGEGDDHS